MQELICSHAYRAEIEILHCNAAKIWQYPVRLNWNQWLFKKIFIQKKRIMSSFKQWLMWETWLNPHILHNILNCGLANWCIKMNQNAMFLIIFQNESTLMDYCINPKSKSHFKVEMPISFSLQALTVNWISQVFVVLVNKTRLFQMAMGISSHFFDI